MKALPPWPTEFVAVAKTMWIAGVRRSEIVSKMMPEAKKLGRVITVNTLNGFAIRLGWGKHPDTPAHRSRKSPSSRGIRAFRSQEARRTGI